MQNTVTPIRYTSSSYYVQQAIEHVTLTIAIITYCVHNSILYFIIVPQFATLLYGCVCQPVTNEYVMLC